MKFNENNIFISIMTHIFKLKYVWLLTNNTIKQQNENLRVVNSNEHR